MEYLTHATRRLLYAAFVLLTRTIALLTFHRQIHNSRFAYAHELASLITSLLETLPALLLGVSYLNLPISVRPTKTRRELGNLLVVAPTRRGKGLLATSQLLTWQGSVIVNDIKGELFQQTAGYRATLGPVFVIDPKGIGHSYDPLRDKKTEDELFSAATHLLFKPDEGDGTIFTQRATVMLTQLFLAARIENIPPLPYVRALVRLGFPAAASRLNSISPELATQFLDLQFNQLNLTDRFLLSAWGTLSARMRPLLTETVVRSLTSADFQASEFMTGGKPVTLYLRWPERDLLALSPLVRLFWGSLIDELISTYDKLDGKNCRPILLLVDEAGRTAIPSLADHATTVVGRGISLWIAVQSLSQLDAVYGKTRASILRDNMESQIYYRPSNQLTADYLEHCLGRRSEFAHSQTTREGTNTSLGLSEQAVPLMTAQFIKQLKDEEIIGFHHRLPAFRARRMDWRDFPLLVQRKEMSPPQLPVLPKVEDVAWQTNEPSISQYIDPDAFA